MDEVKRATAYKIWIGDLTKGSYGRGSGQFDPGYVTIKNMNISRVNIIVSLIDKFSGDNYINAVVDDGTGTLKLRKLELVKLYGEISRIETKYTMENEDNFNQVVEEKVVDYDERDKILGLISSLDPGDGADLENVVT